MNTLTLSPIHAARACCAAMLLLLAAAPGARAADGYQMKLTFSGYTRPETLNNFPVLVVLSNNVGGSGLNFGTHPFLDPNGFDLRFKDAASSALNYEIESWNTNGACYVWVQALSLQGSGSDFITASWGDPSATNRLACTTNGSVWSGSYLGVWHLDHTNAPGKTPDSTSGNWTGTLSATAPTNLAGPVARGYGFDGSATYLDTGTNTIRGQAKLTVEVWGRATAALTGYKALAGNRDQFLLRGNGSHKLELCVASSGANGSLGSSIASSAASIDDGAWHYCAGVYDGTFNTAFVDAQPGTAQSKSGSLLSGGSNPIYIGKEPNGFNWGGGLDEVRISSAARSTNWIWATFLNVASNSTAAGFATYDAVKSANQVAPTLANGAVTNVTISSATFVGLLASTGSAPATVSVFWGTSDGRTNWGAWANTNTFAAGQWGSGSTPFTNLATLASDTNYYYTFYATNIAGDIWGSPSVKFITGALTTLATDSSLGVTATDTATVVISRPAGCTNEALVVNYTLGGTATNNVNYTVDPASGFLLAAGQASTTVTLTPKAPWNYGSPLNIVLSIAPGAYATGLLSSVTCTLEKKLEYLSYSSTTFAERWANDGVMGNAITITMPTNAAGLSLDLFAGSNGSDLVAAGKVQVANVPAGLSASAVRTATNTVQLALAGAANNHLASASVSNLMVTFLDSAFAGGSAAIVVNAVQSNLAVNFVSAYYPSNLYVSTTGSDSTGDGTVTNPVATLAKALTLARSDANDTVHLLPGTYTQSNIAFNAIVTVTGDTRDNTILQAWPTPFNAVNTNLYLLDYGWVRAGAVRNLTLQHANDVFGSGGAIRLGNNGSYNCYFKIENCRFLRNATYKAGQFQGGGAINSECPVPGGVEIYNCEFVENRTLCDGGAVRCYAAGPAISNCVFVGNQSGRAGGAVSGGFNVFYARSSFFAGNAATNSGGAMAGTTLYATNCTFATNTAAAGGAVSCVNGTLVQCTLYGNTATIGGGLDGATFSLYNSTLYQNNASLTGGGVRCANQYHSWSSIVAGNTAPIGPDLNPYTLGTVANSLVGNNANSGLTAAAPDANTNYIGTAVSPVSPGLAPLAVNGGSLPTCALQPGSVAIDHGSNPLGLTWDQRGAGYARAYAPKPQPSLADMGAYEYGAAPSRAGTAVFFR